MQTFTDIICCWDSTSDYADDIGVSHGHAAVMKHRNKIPDRYWNRTVEAAHRRGFAAVTLELLANLAQRNKEAA